MELYLLRHGRTAANRERRYCGASDPPLDAEGITELHKLKDEYIYPAPSRVFTTGLARTCQTAELLFPGVPKEESPALREYDFGEFELHTYEELKSDSRYIDWITDESGVVRCPGGESRALFYQRIRDGFRELLARFNKNDRAAVVCHGGTICAIMEYFCTEKRGFYEWQPAFGHGYAVQVSQNADRKPIVKILKTI